MDTTGTQGIREVYMPTMIIAYGSTTGNTAVMAAFLAEFFKKADIEVAVKNIVGIKPVNLADFDIILLGSSTWGTGKLQDNFYPFYFNMGEVSLAEKKAAVFGPGDSYSYPRSFCKAVDVLERKLKDCGAHIIVPGLKVNGEIKDSRAEMEEWAGKILASVSVNS
jgi:flavodoxin I